MTKNKKIVIIVSTILVIVMLAVIGWSLYQHFKPLRDYTRVIEDYWLIDLPENMRPTEVVALNVSWDSKGDRYYVFDCGELQEPFVSALEDGNQAFCDAYVERFDEKVYDTIPREKFKPTWQNYKCKQITDKQEKMFLIYEPNEKRIIIFESEM
ncbi:MAG: hypothetical protein RR993_04090 [Clostridia bacterium]